MTICGTRPTPACAALSPLEQVACAPVGQIEEAIRIAGLSRQKAARMKDILAW